MHSVDSFFPPIEKSGVPNSHAALAVLENNALRTQGGKALVEPMQNHSIHFDTHMQDAMAHAQQGGLGMPQLPPQPQSTGPSGLMGPTIGMNGNNASAPGSAPPSPTPPLPPSRNGVPQQPQGQNGGAPAEDPMKILIHLENAGPHMFQHLQALQGDPTRQQEVMQKQKQLDQLGKMSDQLHQQVTQQMEAQAANAPQQPGQPDPDMVAKMTKVKGDLAIKEQKMQADHDLKIRKQQFNETLADKKTAAGIQRDTAKTGADVSRTQTGMALETQRTGQGMALERARTGQGMAVVSAKTRHGMSIAERKARHDAKLKEKAAAAAAAKPKPKAE